MNLKELGIARILTKVKDKSLKQSKAANSEILGSDWKWKEGYLKGSQEIEKSIYNLRQTEISNERTKSGEAKDLPTSTKFLTKHLIISRLTTSYYTTFLMF